MDSVKALENIIRDLHALANSLEASMTREEAAPLPEPEKTKPAAAAAEKKLSIADVRAVLGKKVTSDAKALLRKHGKDKLSEFDPADYAQLIMEAEELPDAAK